MKHPFFVSQPQDSICCLEEERYYSFAGGSVMGFNDYRKIQS